MATQVKMRSSDPKRKLFLYGADKSLCKSHGEELTRYGAKQKFIQKKKKREKEEDNFFRSFPLVTVSMHSYLAVN